MSGIRSIVPVNAPEHAGDHGAAVAAPRGAGGVAGIPAIAPYPMPAADDLPANTVGWTADPARAVLLVHDMQRYFLAAFPGGSPREDLVRNASRLRDRCAELRVPVAYTAQPGGMTARQRGLLADFWGPGMTVGAADREIVGPLAPAAGDWLLTKWRYSAFFGSDLLDRMRGENRDQLIVCGVYAHVGVLTTALDSFSNDIQTFLAADAMADFSEDLHRLALTHASRCCAVVALTESLVAHLTRGPGEERRTR